MAPAMVLINDGNVVTEPPPLLVSPPHKAHSQYVNGKQHVTTVQNGFKEQKGTKGTSHVLHRSLHHDPLRVIHAKGNYLYLNDGRKIFDATGGAAVACLGHGDERVRDALLQQMDAVSYCHSLFFATNATEELANILISTTYDEMARVFVVSSGSEAMESALKLARQYHVEKTPKEEERSHFIARKQSYHGTTLGALAAGGHVSRRALFEPMLSTNVSHVSPCYAYRGILGFFESEENYVRRLEAELEAEFQRIGPEKVAAFIAEPVVGAALGCVPPVPGYFKAVRRVCDKYGALLIMDEIMSGCGRVGPEPTERYPKPLHAWQDPLIGIVPDIMTLGKGLGGGYMPVAAVMANHRVIDVLYKGSGAFSHGQTYQGHPVACRAAVEVQRVIRDDNLVANVREKGELLGRLLKEKLGSYWAVGDIRGKGLFWGIEFVIDAKPKTPFDPSDAIAMGIHEFAMQDPFNISLYPGSGTMDGRRGDHVLIAPAYNVTEEEIRQIVDTTVRVIKQFFRKYADRSLLPEGKLIPGQVAAKYMNRFPER